MSLTELKGKNKKAKKRVGRGNGSGHGTYACKGQKGQKSRSGGNRRPGFEGGQTPLSRKMPKLKGFKNVNTITYQAINVGDLEKLFQETELDLTNKRKPVKLLGDGDVSKAFNIKVAKASASAIEKIEKAGGKVEVEPPAKKTPIKKEHVDKVAVDKTPAEAKPKE